MEEESGSGQRRSSRRVISSAKEQQKSALEELRNARKSGKAYRRNTDNLVKDVYELVSEEEYEKIQNQRARENFVEDDDGTGYYDYGDDDDFEEEEEYGKVSSSKSDRKTLEEKRKKKKTGMYAFLNLNPASKEKASENEPCNLDKDGDMLDMLNQLDQSYNDCSSMTEGLAFGFGTTDFVEPEDTQFDESFRGVFSWPAESPFDDPMEPMKPVESTRTESIESTDNPLKRSKPISPTNVVAPKILKLDEEKKKELAATEKTDEVLQESRPLFSDEQLAKFDTVDKFDEAEEEEQIEIAEQPTDSLRMYWIETFENVYKDPGSVYLFGKIGGKSCCVVVRNIEHKIYFLPRKINGDSAQILAEVQKEVEQKLSINAFFPTSTARIRNFTCKSTEIKWIPTDENIPREIPALMLMYKGHHPKVPQNTTGTTFSHVLNTTATSMERLLLESKLRGPCWIDIRNATESKKRLSHCDLEYLVDMKSSGEYNIQAAETKRASPCVNLLILNIVSVPSSDGKDTEIIMISGLYRNKGLLDRANSRSQQAYETFCLMTNPKRGVMPLSFDAQLKSAKIEPESVKKLPNERVLMHSFFAKLKQLDPDVLILHDASAQLSLLISRAEKYDVKTWSFIGRLNQTQAPGRLCKTKAGQWELMAGRSVLCSKTAAEELFPTRSYELGDLVALLMPGASHVQLTFAQIVEPFTVAKPTLSVSQLIQWSWLEAYFALQIVLQLNALPLFIQITQIVGGVLSRTLLGGRSERNEYLLLHAFYESGYIPPDKHILGAKKKGKADNDEDEDKKGPAKKAQYTGGLVLEPKKGFYDSYIVLLDFNSLYPSIIQEFNICFTTIDRCYDEPDEKGLPEPPKDTVPEGILSLQIGNLVRNRRDVKSQMQKVKPGTDEYLRLDVRQKGLKLTANSMYGCLGFGMSRFSAKTLAAMITSKGRELLSRTKDMVEKRGYTVVYGDTDSIMVNTNTQIHSEACRLAFDLRKIVNGGFKYVEMDVDGLFKRLLLLKKKKYAALTVSLKSDSDPKKEMKGLDIVRRDWSKLAKDVGERIVDLILNSKDREELVNDISSTLNELAENLKENKLPPEDFEILKQLAKAPKDYVDVKNQPHVMVAQRLNSSKGFKFRQGDIIKYVICQDGTNNSAVQRAYHLSEIANNEDLKIDSYYYLSQQVHPVVMRLCEPFSELDASRIAESLGLDPTGYRHHRTAEQPVYDPFDIAANTFSDFDQCEGFKFECPECKKFVVIRSILEEQAPNISFALNDCPECHCDLVYYEDTLRSLLVVQLNGFLKKYMEAKYVCDDQTCAYQGSDPVELTWISSQGPLCPQCESTFMHKEFSLRDLFFQQKFFKSIFDQKTCLDKHCSKEQKKTLEKKPTFKDTCRMYDNFESLTLEQLKNNRYNRIDLGRVLSGFKRLY